MTPINTIKNWFTTGSKPTQTQFWQVFDSYRHKSEAIPMLNVSGLNDALANKADVSMLNLKANKDATGLSGNNILSWKEALGIHDFDIAFTNDESLDNGFDTPIVPVKMLAFDTNFFKYVLDSVNGVILIQPKEGFLPLETDLT